MEHLSWGRVRRLRARAQQIGSGQRQPSVAGVVTHAAGIQAQDLRAAAIGCWARGEQIAESDVVTARDHDRSIVRGWLMRGTLQYVPAEDYCWLSRLLSPIGRKSSERRCAELQLDLATLARVERLAIDAIDERGACPRSEFYMRLEADGIDCAGQRGFHALRHLVLSDVLCFGPCSGDEPAFVRTDDWVTTSTVPPDDPEVELARRYLTAYGPASVEDFAGWSGLQLRVARPAWKRLLDTVAFVVDGAEQRLPCSRVGELDDPEPEHDVRFLPAFDNYLTAYRNRAGIVDPADERQVWPGGGLIRPTIVVDGSVVGTWTRGSTRRTAVQMQMRADVPDSVTTAVTEEMERLREFLLG